ncbi:MAG: hypothetical protein HDR07_11830 [Lachnospiraceae bacterium]|nr:hypothetical protein [Lachnospiraceae bacterium]
MNYNAINELIVSVELSGHESFWEYDGEFFMLFYNRFKDTPFTDIPDIAFMYMEINNWWGMSVRSGVWQYYESGAFEKGKFERVLSFLKTNGEEEMANVYACGIHDYTNERYQKNYDYPEEWFDEAERIDEWISGNEGYIYKWMYDLILGHKSEVIKLGDK